MKQRPSSKTCQSSIQVSFSKTGLRSFEQVNQHLGKKRITFWELTSELAEYIKHHWDIGDQMLSESDVRYDDGIYLTVYRSGGIYFIKEVVYRIRNIARFPVFVWKRIKKGYRSVLTQVLAGWSTVYHPSKLQTVKCY